MSKVQIGDHVFALFNGKICRGVVLESHKYPITKLPHGIMFSKGFTVKWYEGKNDIIEHHDSEFNQSIFYSKEEVIESIKATFIKSKTKLLSNCKDYYGLELNVGDEVKSISGCDIYGRISEIYMGTNKEDDSYSYPLMKIVDKDGYYVCIDADPRCFTKMSRYNKITEAF